MIIPRSIYVAASGIISFFIMAEEYSIVYVYHIFFIHFSADGHLGYFHVVAIVNSAITTTGVHSSFWMRVFSRYMPRNGIAKSYGSSIVVFKGASMLFSIMAAPIYIPTNSGGGFPFLYTLSSL